MIKVIPLDYLGEIAPGDDLAALLSQGQKFRQGDVLVITQKIVSKADGLFVDLATVRPGSKAVRLARLTGKDPRLVELILRESVAVVRAAPHVLITRHQRGWVMANAGIDQSNIGPGRVDQTADRVLLLPRDPDARAVAIRDRLGEPAPGVVICDSFGRPWRLGVVNVALGAAGLPALLDHRGERDRDGRRLAVTQIAFADQIASAAGLAMGEGAGGVPAVIVRGLTWTAPDAPAAALVRPVSEDLFQ